MTNLYNLNQLKEKFKNLLENINEEIQYVGSQKLGIDKNEFYPLSKILSEILERPFEMNFKNNQSSYSEEVIHYLTYELIFLNDKCPHGNHTNNEKKVLNSNKWLEAVYIVLESIANYFHVPFLDIIKEVVKLGSIIIK